MSHERQKDIQETEEKVLNKIWEILQDVPLELDGGNFCYSNDKYRIQLEKCWMMQHVVVCVNGVQIQKKSPRLLELYNRAYDKAIERYKQEKWDFDKKQLLSVFE